MGCFTAPCPTSAAANIAPPTVPASPVRVDGLPGQVPEGNAFKNRRQTVSADIPQKTMRLVVSITGKRRSIRLYI
ncbi:MAG: hypothetical protein ABFD75_15660 [Smithella sp.]